MRCRGTRRSALVLAVVGLAVLTAASASRAQEVWRDGLTLGEAVVLARETHPSLGAARANEAAASSALGQAKSRWWPTRWRASSTR